MSPNLAVVNWLGKTVRELQQRVADLEKTKVITISIFDSLNQHQSTMQQHQEDVRHVPKIITEVQEPILVEVPQVQTVEAVKKPIKEKKDSVAGATKSVTEDDLAQEITEDHLTVQQDIARPETQAIDAYNDAHQFDFVHDAPAIPSFAQAYQLFDKLTNKDLPLMLSSQISSALEVQLAGKFEEQSNDLERKFHGILATLNTNVEQADKTARQAMEKVVRLVPKISSEVAVAVQVPEVQQPKKKNSLDDCVKKCDENDNMLRGARAKKPPEDDLAQEMTQGLEMKFNKIAPLGKEDTAVPQWYTIGKNCRDTLLRERLMPTSHELACICAPVVQQYGRRELSSTWECQIDVAQSHTNAVAVQVPKVQIKEVVQQDIDDEFSKADGEVADSQDILHVCKRTLESMQEKLKKSEDITKEDVTDLTSPAQLADEEIMVPVDMRGVNEEFEDVDQMIEKLGPKGTAEAFVKAHEYFKANKDNEPEDERPAPMTAAKWRQILDEQDEGDDGDDIEDEFSEDIDDEFSYYCDD